MKKLSIALLGLVVLLVVAILVGPSFIDWNSQKGRITAEVERWTGRKLAIDGDLSLTILPAPAFSAARVRFANMEGGSAPSMIELESLDIRVALIPLVQGRVEVESVDLVRPTILVEVLADGRGNWEIAGPPAAASAAPTGGPGQTDDGGGGFFDQVRLQSVRISDGTLIYRDATAGSEERIAGLNAEIAAGSLNGPFGVAGDAEVRGIKTAFDVTIGQLVAQGATSLNVNLELPDAGAKARFGGAISRHPDGVSLRGQIKAEGGNLAAVAALLAGHGVGPGMLAQPFEVETELSVDLQQATASELAFRLGDTEIEGEVRVKLGPPLDVRVNLSASRLDLDKLLVAGGAAAPATQPSSGQSGGQSSAPSGPGPTLPSNISATVELNVDALVYHRQVVRQLLVSMSLAGGQLRVSQALALLPGGSDVSVTGVLAPAKAAAGPELRFTGRLEAASDNLRGMLQWLGANVASVPPERLRRMSLSAKIDASANQATVSDIDLRIDVSRVTGGIAVALRERPGFGIGLAIDKLNLDAYLPRPGAQTAGATQVGQTEQAGEAGQETAAGTAGPLAVLAGFDANLDLSMGSLSLRDVTARQLKLDATLKQGAVVLRDVTIGDLAGSQLRLSGMLSDLAATPSIDAEVALSVPDPGKLAKLVGQDAAALARIGAFELSGTVTGTLARAGLDATLTALGGRFGAAGTIQPLASPLGFDLKLVAKHPDLAKLGRALDIGPALGPGLGGMELALGLSGTPARIQIAKLAGNLGPATLSGGFAADLSGPAPVLSGVDLGVALRHSDLGGLIQALSPGAAPGAAVRQGLGAVDLKGRITGGAGVFQVADLAGRLGPAEFSGRLGADLSGAKPALTIELTTGELPLAALMAAGGGGASNGTASAGTASGGRRDRWSSDPIDVSGLNAVNAEVKLKAQALLLENTRLDRVTLEASLVDGQLDLRRFDSSIYDGALAITGKLDARKTLEVGLAVTAIELNLARLLHDLAESDRVSGPLSLNASLSTRGGSEAELVAALSGGGKLDGTLRVKAKQEERVGSQLLGIAGALLGQKIKEFDQIRGLTDATNVLFNAFADAPAAVTGSFTVDRGVVVTSDLRVDGRQAVALTQARADLPRWLLDSQTDVFLAADPNRPYVTVGLRGPLDAPNPRLSGAPLQPRQQLAPVPSTGPAPSTSGQIQTAPQPAPETEKPEDLLRQGLEQGLKKLFGN